MAPIPQGLVMLLAVACGFDGAKATPSGDGRNAPVTRLAVTRAGGESRTRANASSCQAKTFPNVAQATRECFEANAGRRGHITWTGDNESGTFTYERAAVRVKTHYAYSPTSLDLTLTILDKPWLASCRMLYGRYSDGLEDCGY